MEARNDVIIKGNGRLSEFFAFITCIRLTNGAAKKQTVIIQQTVPEIKNRFFLDE